MERAVLGITIGEKKPDEWFGGLGNHHKWKTYCNDRSKVKMGRTCG